MTLDLRKSRACNRQPPIFFMEPVWRSRGHASYGEWLKAEGKARRVAKKAALPKATVQWKVAVRWPSPQQGTVRSRSGSPASRGGERLQIRTDSEFGLPGQLREDVAVTPRGRRQHHVEHTSPMGTTRSDEYFSPSGLRDHACEHRSACFSCVSYPRPLRPQTAGLRRARSNLFGRMIQDQWRTAKRERIAAEQERAAAEHERDLHAGPPRSREALAARIQARTQAEGYWYRYGSATMLRCYECAACDFASMYRERMLSTGHTELHHCKYTSLWISWLNGAAPCQDALYRSGYRRSEFGTVYELLGSYVCNCQRMESRQTQRIGSHSQSMLSLRDSTSVNS